MEKRAASSCIIGMLFIYYTDAAVASEGLAVYSDTCKYSEWFPDVSYEQIRTWALALGGFAAVVTLFMTWLNVRASTRQQRASVLFDLDVRWEGQGLKVPKKDAYGMLTAAMENAESLYETEEFEREVSQRLKKDLNEIYIHNREKHDGLMDILSFLETIGHATRNGYIPLQDVVSLFGGAILSTRLLFKAHIDEMQAQDKNAYANTTWLFQETQKIVNRQTFTPRLKRRIFRFFRLHQAFS